MCGVYPKISTAAAGLLQVQTQAGSLATVLIVVRMHHAALKNVTTGFTGYEVSVKDQYAKSR